MGVLKSLGTHLERVLAGCSCGAITCEHSQELTPGPLELKVTDVFKASVPFMAS